MQGGKSLVKRLLLIESDIDTSEEGLKVYWSRTKEGAISLPRLVDENTARLREEYIRFVEAIGRLKTPKGDVIETLTPSGFKSSLWWTSILADKSPYKSSAIYKALKLKVFEEFLRKNPTEELCYVGADRALNLVLENWGKKAGFKYSWQNRGQPEAISFREKLPHFFAGLALLFFRTITKYLKRPKRSSDETSLRIVTYFPNFDESKSEYWSNYWEDLHRFLPQSVEWLWIFSPSKKMNFSRAREWQEKFQSREPQSRFYFVEDFLGVRDALKALSVFIGVSARTRRLRANPPALTFPNSKIDLYPLYEFEWKSALAGANTMDGILYHLAFKNWAGNSSAPILYTFEGQAWEKALVSYAKGPTVGVQHSALRSFDLRVAADSESRFPKPTLVAANGEGAKQMLSTAGWPAQKVIVLEALRYGYLSNQWQNLSDPSGEALLVVTDYYLSEALDQLKLLDEAIAPGAYSKILVKPHPFIDPKELAAQPWRNSFEFTTEPLSKLWKETRVVFGASSTTAVLEGAWVGLPVVLMRGGRFLNLCPLPLGTNYQLVDSPAGLKSSLKSPTSFEIQREFFALNPEFPRWKKLLLALETKGAATLDTPGLM